MKKIIYLGLLISCVHIAAFSQVPIQKFNQSQIEEVASSLYWHRLLHYRPALIHQFKSQISESLFFLAADGRINPLAELKATLHFFNTNQKIGRFQQTPQCAFPERFRFLRQQFNLQTKLEECAELKDWLEGFSGDSAAIVYSSAFPNSPASIFGHTLLRINSKKKQMTSTRRDLLDYSVSYAAAMSDESPLEYAWKGLFGGFPGATTVSPYYIKVNEYVKSENRDLWEYNINLKPEQIENMLRHIWEIQNSADISYYFIDENCAYFLLVLLEIANPEWDFIGKTTWYVSPAQSIKILADTTGVVTKVQFRPSAFKVMQFRMDKLSQDQLKILSTLLESRSVEIKTQIESPAIIDAALDYMQYIRAEKNGQQSDEEKVFYRSLLIARSKMTEINDQNFLMDESKMSQDSRPDQSHDTMQVGTSAGTVNDRYAQDFHLRMGLSDFVNDDTGLTPYASLQWLEAQVRYLESSKKWAFENLRFLQVKSLFPRNTVQKDISWGFDFNYLTPHDLACESCHVMHVEGSAGQAWSWGSSLVFGFFISGYTEAGQILNKGYRLGPSLDFEAVYEFTKRFKTHFLVREVFDADLAGRTERRANFTDITLEQGWTLSKKWDIRFKAHYIPGDGKMSAYSEIMAGGNFYF